MNKKAFDKILDSRIRTHHRVIKISEDKIIYYDPSLFELIMQEVKPNFKFTYWELMKLQLPFKKGIYKYDELSDITLESKKEYENNSAVYFKVKGNDDSNELMLTDLYGNFVPAIIHTNTKNAFKPLTIDHCPSLWVVFYEYFKTNIDMLTEYNNYVKPHIEKNTNASLKKNSSKLKTEFKKLDSEIKVKIYSEIDTLLNYLFDKYELYLVPAHLNTSSLNYHSLKYIKENINL